VCVVSVMRKLTDSKRVLVSLPLEIRNWLAERASYNAATISSEVVRAVRASMEREADAKARKSIAVGE
jgi:hypothetical protein